MPFSRRLTLGGLLLSFVVASAGTAAVVSTGAIHTVASGESLARIAARAYGNGRAWPAILLATNSRLAGIAELDFIGDPNLVQPGQKVWIPVPDEQDRWLRSYRAYVAAVLDMSLPQPWEVSRNLVAISKDSPVRLVTWARQGQFSLGRSVAGKQIWVTVAPHLRDFCRALGETADLVARLEQRLGLPPASNKTEVVEILLENPGDGLFRPCAEPDIDTTTCPLGPPGVVVDPEHRDWFLAQYFASYAQAHPTRYPWTSLGYTYDWGDPDSEEGEAEFVIRPEATIEVVSITPTDEYCRP